MSHRRPSGVTILAVLQWVGSALSLLGGLLFIVSAGGGRVPVGLSGMSVIPLILGVGLVVSGTIGLIAGYGLFTLKGWGWWLAVIFSGLSLLSGLGSLLLGADGSVLVPSLVIPGLVLYYLYTPAVRRAFGKI